MFISYSTKEEEVNNDIETIYTVNIILDGEKYYYESLTPITVNEVKRKLERLKIYISLEVMVNET